MRIIILFNHFQIQDGVARCAMGIANALAQKSNIEVTLCPLFRLDKTMISGLSDRVIIKPVFRTYFRGLSRIIGKFPMKMLYKWIIGDKYDIKIGLCMSLPIRIVAADPILDLKYDISNSKKKSFAWMHCYDVGLTLYDEYKRIGKVVCVSKYCAERLLKESSGEFAVDYAYNLLDNERICEKGKEDIPVMRSEKIQFISVGRLSPEKGYLRLLEICKKLVNEGYKFNLWIVGDGIQRIELENKSKDLGLNNVVTFLGEQENPHAYTAKSDVFICSSFDEGYSTACTEAIMLGVPVITTSVSGGDEIISEARCGLLVGTENEELYKGIKEVLDRPELIKKWKEILNETKYNFSYKARTKKLYDVLEME